MILSLNPMALFGKMSNKNHVTLLINSKSGDLYFFFFYPQRQPSKILSSNVTQ